MKAFRIAMLAGLCLTQGVSIADEQNPQQVANVGANGQKPGARAAESYKLGPGDEIVVRCLDAEEFSDKPVRIDTDGYGSFPLVGRVQTAGISIKDLSTELASLLKKFIRDPQVSITVKEYRSQPVSVLGAVNAPGVHQLQGVKSLSELLSLAGGLRTDAGDTVNITRQLQNGTIPLKDARLDSSGKFSVADVDLNDILRARKPERNIQILANDVISVPKAELVYVVGEVMKPGGYVLNGRKTLSVLKAISLSEGLVRTASPQNARILKSSDGESQKVELAVNIKKILEGKAPDLELNADDILFVPGSTGKKIAFRAIEAAIQTGSGVAIWRTSAR